ncbi:MAG: RICIN domain-containing protein [Saprospiraceae bacterium]|nr:RICIN domain-containing protein [Saprospiraceae bacterium]
MNRNLYFRIVVFLMALLPLSISAQCVTRNVTNCKNYDPNQAIGAAMQGFFTDGSTGSFQWLPGATIQDCANGTAVLTGKLQHFGNADRVFNVSIQFVRRSCNLAPGSFQETDNLPPGTPTTGWYYYEWGTATMTGEGHLAGAQLNLVMHMMPAQAGVNAHNQAPDVGKLGVTGWFEWQIVSQPSNGWLTIAPYAGGIADVCFVMDGTPPNYCNGDPCVTNPVPTPSVNVTNATNGGANGCIDITNLPAGASSSINGSTPVVDKTQYCGLVAGTYTITVSKDGCTKSATVTVGNTNTDPCITNPVPTPSVNVTNATNGGANGCIDITNLPAGASSSINNGAATVGKTQYCGLAAGTYTITVNLNGCIKSVTVTVGNNNTDPCITNPVPTPTYTVTNATNGGANGCINITNLPVGASSSINNGAATVGKTQYCGLAAGTYTITVNLNGCIKSVTVTVGNNNTDPCITNPVPTPTYTVTNATNGGANGCINITNLPAGASSSINNGAATVGKTQYCGLTAGTYTITVNLNGCIKSVTVTVGNTVNCTVTGNTISKTCVNNIPVINGAALAGYEYMWLKSTTGCPNQSSQAIAGATGQNYTLPSRVTVTTYFVRCARPIGCTTWGTINESNCVTVYATDCAPTVNCNSVTGNTISKTCVNNIPVINGAALAGYEYMWLKSTTGCPNQSSQAIAGATGQNYTLPSRVTSTTYFVRCARPIGCTTWGTINESNCVTVYATDCAPAPTCTTTFDGTKCYRIVSVATGKVLDVASFSYSDNALVQQWSYNGGTNQKWQISSIGSGYFKINARHSGKSLACHYTSTGSQVYQYTYYTGGAKDWKIECTASGYYKITHRLSGKVLDLSGSSTTNGAKIQIWDWNGGNNQLWKIEAVSCTNGVYSSNADVTTMEAHPELNRARLEWVNNTGYKNDFFTVEKMNAQSGDFEKLETVNSKYSDTPEYYVAFDNNPTEGDNFYRVAVTFNDGTVSYSETKKVTFKSLSDVRVFPNPADEYIDIDLKQYKGTEVNIFLYNSFGQQVQYMNISKVSDNMTRLDVSAQSTGNYMLRVTSADKRAVTKQVIISK